MKKNLFIAMFLVLVLALTAAQTAGNAGFSMGTWNKNVYKNDFLDIKFKLPDGWKKYGDEEMAELMNLGTDLLNDNQKYITELAKLNLVYYFLVNNPSTGDAILVMSEKSALDYTLDYYLVATKTQLETLDKINYQVGEIRTEKVAGKEYGSFLAAVNMGGICKFQKYYVRKMDKYFVSIIATSGNGEEAINDMMKNFK